MKKNKLLNLLLRSGSSNKSVNNHEEEILTSSIGLSRCSTRRNSQDVYQQKAVERSSSWKYTPDLTTESYSMNSSPSLLEAGENQISEDNEPLTVLEKSHSWSGDRILDSTTDSGSSLGIINNISFNSGTHSSNTIHPNILPANNSISKTGTSNRALISNLSSQEQTSGKKMSSRGGSDYGDSTPSSVYDQERYTSYTDADGYENVELPSPPKECCDSSSGQENVSFHSGRLIVKSNSRQSRKPSPRRCYQSKDQNIEGVSEHEFYINVKHDSIRGKVPSINLCSSTPAPSRSVSRRTSNDSSISPKTIKSRTPSISPSRRLSKSSSRTAIRASSRSPQRSNEERLKHEINNEIDNVNFPKDQFVDNSNKGSQTPIWKTQSWQDYNNVKNQHSKQYLKSRSWHQQQTLSIAPEIKREKPQHITRQEAVQYSSFGKSRSWQQSHEKEPVHEQLSRSYTVSERRRSSRSSVCINPSSTVNRSHKSTDSHHHNTDNRQHPIFQDARVQYQTSFVQHQQKLQQQLHQQQQIGRNKVHGYISVGSGFPYNASDYVDLRNYENSDQHNLIDEKRCNFPDPKYQFQNRSSHGQRIRNFRNQNELSSSSRASQDNQSYHTSQEQYIRSRVHELPAYQQQQLQQIQKLNRRHSNRKSDKERIIYLSSQGTPVMENDYAIFDNKTSHITSYDNSRSDLVKSRYIGDHIPVKASSLMSSVELLSTLKRQLALSSPPSSGRSKSLEAGRAAGSLSVHQSDSIKEGDVIPQQRLSPALQALVAEKRARLKRSAGIYSGSCTIIIIYTLKFYQKSCIFLFPKVNLCFKP